MAIQYLVRPRGVSPDSYGSFVIFNYSKSIEFDSYGDLYPRSAELYHYDFRILTTL